MSQETEFPEYNARVVPLLEDLANACTDLGLPVVAFIELGDGAFSTTTAALTKSTFPMNLVVWAAKVLGDVDELVQFVSMHAKEVGHSSFILKLLGVPEDPSIPGSETIN